jgi:hypothetical protein
VGRRGALSAPALCLSGAASLARADSSFGVRALEQLDSQGTSLRQTHEPMRTCMRWQITLSEDPGLAYGTCIDGRGDAAKGDLRALEQASYGSFGTSRVTLQGDGYLQ